jgi:hypothetical protein
MAPRTTERHAGRFVAIDVDSGAFEVASDELAAAHGLRARYPAAQIWLRRVDVPYLIVSAPVPATGAGGCTGDSVIHLIHTSADARTARGSHLPRAGSFAPQGESSRRGGCISVLSSRLSVLLSPA